MVTITFEKKCAIFKHLIQNPQLAEDLNFRPEYFISVQGTDDSSKSLSKLYEAMSGMIWEQKMPYSYQTMEIAFFDKIAANNIAYAYCHPENLDDNVKSSLQNAKFQLKSIFDLCESMHSQMSPVFIEHTARDLVNMQVWMYRLNNIQLATLNAQMNMQGTESSEEFSYKMEDEYRKIEQSFLPPNSKVNIYTDFFDARLMIPVSNKLFKSFIDPLNRYLTGGFKSQTVTGFLTKTGGGKSTLLFTLAADALLQGQNVAFINLEMNDYEVNTNILSAICRTETYKSIIGSLTDSEFMEKIKGDIPEGCGRLAIISDEDCRSDISWLEQQIRKTEQRISKNIGEEFSFDIIIIDYLFLMEPSKKMTKNSRSDEVYKQITQEFHKYCQRNDYAGITVFQGNRGAEVKMSNSEKLTLADIGDSYGATRDIENTLSISRYVKPDGTDGILIQPLKLRHYDGSYDEGVFVKYNYDFRCYDSKDAEKIYLETEDEDNKSGKKKPGRKINTVSIGDILDSNVGILEDVCGGTFVSTCNFSRRVSGCSYRNLKSEAESRGLEVKNAKDFDDPDFEEMKRIIQDAIDKAYSFKYSSGKPAGISLDQVNISGKDLFE